MAGKNQPFVPLFTLLIASFTDIPKYDIYITILKGFKKGEINKASPYDL